MSTAPTTPTAPAWLDELVTAELRDRCTTLADRLERIAEELTPLKAEMREIVDMIEQAITRQVEALSAVGVPHETMIDLVLGFLAVAAKMSGWRRVSRAALDIECLADSPIPDPHKGLNLADEDDVAFASATVELPPGPGGKRRRARVAAQ